MFISFVLIQVKRTKEKVKTSTGDTVFCGAILNGLLWINFILHYTYDKILNSYNSGKAG
ncbi:MAG: hypothetical protein J7K51_11035 [Thermotogae bacterium]|nr:hypothetical protein [Thermotogota bacterium]